MFALPIAPSSIIFYGMNEFKIFAYKQENVGTVIKTEVKSDCLTAFGNFKVHLS